MDSRGSPEFHKGISRKLLSLFLGFWEFFRGSFNGLHNVFITGTSAQIPRNPFSNFSAGGGWVFIQQGLCGKDHARGTKAALNGPIFNEILLQGVGSIGSAETPNGRNLSPIRLSSQHQAGIHRAPPQKDRTATAVPLFASIFDFGKTQIPQRPKESEMGGELPLDLFSVYFESKGNPFHRSSSKGSKLIILDGLVKSPSAALRFNFVVAAHL